MSQHWQSRAGYQRFTVELARERKRRTMLRWARQRKVRRWGRGPHYNTWRGCP